MYKPNQNEPQEKLKRALWNVIEKHKPTAQEFGDAVVATVAEYRNKLQDDVARANEDLTYAENAIKAAKAGK